MSDASDGIAQWRTQYVFFSYTNSTHHVGFLMLLSFIHSIFFFIKKTFPPQNTRDVQLTFFFFTMND